MVAAFDDAAFIDHDNSVSHTHSRKAVRDDEHGSVLTNASHVVLNHPLTFVVERTGGFVENKNTWVSD